MERLAYSDEKRDIKRPKAANQRQYKLDRVVLLDRIKKGQNKLKIEIGTYKADLLLLEKDERDIKAEIEECKLVLSDLRREEEKLGRKKEIVDTKPESKRKEQYLAQLEANLREINQEKRIEVQRIKQGRREVSRLKEQEKNIKKTIREKRTINTMAGILKFIVGAAAAKEYAAKNKKRIAIATLLIAGMIGVGAVSKFGDIPGLPEGDRNQEVTMQEDKTSEDLRNNFMDSIRVETPKSEVDIPTSEQIENEQTEMSLPEEELFGIFIENFEGECRLDVYDIGDGTLTMGWGHTEPHGGEYQVGDTITREQAVEFLKEDREWAYSVVDRVSR